MSVTPHPRLLRLAALWLGAALASLWFPAGLPVLLAAAATLALLTVWDAELERRRPAPVLRRRFPERVFLGRPFAVEIEVRNPGPARLDIDLEEALPADLAAGEQPAASLRVAPGGSERFRYAVTPTRRGDRPLGELLTLSRSPLGLLRRGRRAGGDDAFAVYPDTEAMLRPEAVDPRWFVAQLGLRPSRRRGEGMDFESLRDYVPGDDPRHLDWAASARRGRPVVRRYRHEQNHLLLLALDTSRLMAGRWAGRTKLDYAIDAALALACAALSAGDRVAMVLFDASLRGFLPPLRHRRGLGRCIEFVRREQPRLVEANFAALLRGLAARQRQRALLVVLSDFVEAEPEVMARPLAVLGRRHRLLFAAVRDPLFDELDAARRGAPEDYWRRIVLDDLLREREVALARLRRRGLAVLDVPPEQLVAPVLNQYLVLRYGEGGL